MKEIHITELHKVDGGAVVVIIPPLVGGALKVVGFVGAAAGGVVGGHAFVKGFAEIYDSIAEKF